ECDAADAHPRPPALCRRRRRHGLRPRRARRPSRRPPVVRRPGRCGVGTESSRCCSWCCFGCYSRWSVWNAGKRRRFCDLGESLDDVARVARMSGASETIALTLDDGRVETWTVTRTDRTADGAWRLILVDPAGVAHHVEAI